MMKKVVAVVCTFALAGGILAGCSSNSSSDTKSEAKSDTATEQKADTNEVKAPESDVAMNYTTPADLEANMDGYLIVDVRKAEDYKTAHIPGAINADMDKAKDGDFQSGVDNMKAALKEATGSETGADKKMVLVCYSGKKYAQAGTNVLSAIGADMGNVTTLEGGMKAWTGATEA